MKLKDYMIIDEPIKPNGNVDRKAVKERFNKTFKRLTRTKILPIIVFSKIRK